MGEKNISDLPDFILEDFSQLYDTMSEMFRERRIDVILNALCLHSAHLLVEQDSSDEEIEGFITSLKKHVKTMRRVYGRPDNAR